MQYPADISPLFLFNFVSYIFHSSMKAVLFFVVSGGEEMTFIHIGYMIYFLLYFPN